MTNDDHPVPRVAILASAALARAELGALCARDPRVQVVASAARLDELAPALASADVVLLALRPGDRVTTLASLLARLDVVVPVVALMSDALDASVARAAFTAGARAVLHASSSAEEIIAAVIAAAAGLVVAPADAMVTAPSITASNSTADHIDAEGSDGLEHPPPLTPREQDVLALLVEGLPNKRIARRLGISEHTVKTHVEALFDKLAVSSRAEAVANALRHGLIHL